MQIEKQKTSALLSLGYCGDVSFTSLIDPSLLDDHGIPQELDIHDNFQPAIIGCAIVDTDNKVYFSKARSHSELISEVHRQINMYLAYDEVTKGFYNSQGVFLTRRSAFVYMVMNGIPMFGDCHYEVYFYNVWSSQTSKLTNLQLTQPRVKTTTEMMAQKRSIKLSKRKSRKGY